MTPLSLADVYTRFRGASVFYDPLPGGNNGDQLIEMGSRYTHLRYGFKYVDDPAAADLIVVRGNGVLTDSYLNTPHRAHVERLASAFPSVPFVLEPSTLAISNSPVIDSAARTAPTFVFARDERSFMSEKAKRLGLTVELGLDHDMAFSLAGSDFVATALGESRGPRRYGLSVERFDLERPGRAATGSVLRKRLTNLLPTPTAQVARRLVAASRNHSSSSFHMEASRISRDYCGDISLQRGDLSNHRLYSFDAFVKAIAGSEIVFTQRLHVGILSALLGIPTWLDDRGYYKIYEIYRHSLSGLEHVNLMSQTTPIV